MKLRVHERSGGAFRLDGKPVYFGDYRVPQDLTQEQAQAIVDAGVGEFLQEEPVKKSKAKEPDHLA